MAAKQTLTLLVVVRTHYPQPNGALVKRSRHCPFTAVTPVRIWYASPIRNCTQVAIRGSPAKGVGREIDARVRISSVPPHADIAQLAEQRTCNA